MNKPDIDDQIRDVLLGLVADSSQDTFEHIEKGTAQILSALYDRLASEAADYLDCKESPEQNWQNCTCPNAKALPISKLKELFGVGE